MGEFDDNNENSHSYFKFWLLILVTFFIGWLLGIGVLELFIKSIFGV